MDNPFRHAWSKQFERLRHLLRHGEILGKRLADSLTELTPVAPTAGHHPHYCAECDRQWVHEGAMCAINWAAPCQGSGHEGTTTVRPRLGHWLVVVCRDRPELCQQLNESFGDDPRITLVLDRRLCERRRAPAPEASVSAERRGGSPRRTPPTDRNGQVWETLGFRPHRARSLGSR
jgi:hypothetical protein